MLFIIYISVIVIWCLFGFVFFNIYCLNNIINALNKKIDMIEKKNEFKIENILDEFARVTHKI